MLLERGQLKKLWDVCEHWWWRGCSSYEMREVEKSGEEQKGRHPGRNIRDIIKLAQLDLLYKKVGR